MLTPDANTRTGIHIRTYRASKPVRPITHHTIGSISVQYSGFVRDR